MTVRAFEVHCPAASNMESGKLSLFKEIQTLGPLARAAQRKLPEPERYFLRQPSINTDYGAHGCGLPLRHRMRQTRERAWIELYRGVDAHIHSY